MKKLVCVMLFLAFSLPSFAAVIIGKIDIQQIMATVNQGKKANDKLQTQFKKWEDELKKEEGELKKEKDNFDKQKLLKDQKWVQTKQEELQQKFVAIQQKTQNYQMQIQKMEMDEKKPILEKIRAIVSEISEKEKVDLTVEVSASPILYAKDVVDLTTKVIEQYNSKHK